MARTEISTLGEFGLIKHLSKDITPKNDSTEKGIGDDCAVLHYPDSQVLVTSDMLLEGVHFDLTYMPLKHLGYKAAVENISDICAMNGTPQQMIVDLGIGRRFCIENIDELYSGIRLACDRYGVDIVGGDTTSSYTGLSIAITCIGSGKRDEIVYRGGAKEVILARLTWVFNFLSVKKRFLKNKAQKQTLQRKEWRFSSRIFRDMNIL